MNRTLKRHIPCRGVITSATIWALVTAACSPSTNSNAPVLNPEGVLVLLNVMDAVARAHPGFEDTTRRIRALSDPQRGILLAKTRRINEQSSDVATAIATLFRTEAYRLYFDRFTNVTPAVMRDLLLDLPYGRRSGPGGIGEMFHELLRERAAVRAAVERFVAEADMAQVLTTAAYWAPDGSRPPSRLFLIYDSNAGSFTANGVPFFNLYGDVDLAALNSDSSGDALRGAAAVMAHELEHTLAAPFLYPSSRPESPWPSVWIDRITRGLVSEGVAMHCNPPEGFKKELWEDTKVVSALVNRFNDLVVGLAGDGLKEDEVQAWYAENFHSYAEGLLMRFLEQRYSGDELEARRRAHLSMRPDLEHVLGWWMVSRVTEEGRRRDAALSLLRDPYALYSLYDEAVGDRNGGMRVSPEAMRYLSSIREQVQRGEGDS